MFTRFDANKSTKGASKLRRDLINAEIANLRDLLPLPQSTRQRLSQLQLMALVCVYVRKANYFQQALKRYDLLHHPSPTPNIGFSKALSGFLMMLTQNGKLLYISDNAAEYLGHSMEDLLIHGDSVYDIIDKQDHSSIQAELGRNVPQSQHHLLNNSPSGTHMEGERRMFLCRMNVSRNARRQMRFGDQKVVLVQGHYLSYLPLCSRNEPVFLATCTPIAMPETRECVVQGATNVFTTIHSMDMKIVHIDKNGEFHLGYQKAEIQGLSWYQLLHWDSTKEAQTKHRLITQSEQDRSGILLVQMQKRSGEFVWVHCVLQVRDSQDSNQQPVIVCTNQVLSDREASVLLANSWLYHYYSVQSKIQFGMTYDQTIQTPARLPSHSPSLHHQYYHSSPPMPSHGMNHHPYPGHHSHLHYGYQSPIAPHNNHSYHGQSHHQNHPNSPILSQLNGRPPESEAINDLGKSSKTMVVDYRQVGGRANDRGSPPDCRNYGSPPPIKKRIIARPDPIYIPDQMESPEGSLTEIHGSGISDGHNHTLILGPVGHSIRSRYVGKIQPVQHSDSTEFIDQWNPSPPWSEAAQKVPDISHHELSPYMTTTTPPTPNSGTNGAATSPGFNRGGVSIPNSNGTAFSFDWIPEQFVPIVDCSATQPGNCVPYLAPADIPIHLHPIPMTHWPQTGLVSSHNNDTGNHQQHRRLLVLDTASDRSSNNGKDDKNNGKSPKDQPRPNSK